MMTLDNKQTDEGGALVKSPFPKERESKVAHTGTRHEKPSK